MSAMSVHMSDEEALSGCPRDLDIKACAGFTILWFLPYRRVSGVLEIPESKRPESVEAVVIHDASEHQLDFGVVVGCAREGEYFTYQGHKLCRVPGSALVLVDTHYSPEENLHESFSV